MFYKPLNRLKSTSELIFILKKLHIFLKRGLTLSVALGLLQESTNNKSLQNKVKQLQTDLHHGFHLSYSFKKNFACSDYLVFLLKLAEKNGHLDVQLNLMIGHIEKQQQLTRKLILNLSYPLILLLIMALIFFVFIYIIIPEFNDFFVRFDKELPPFSKFIFSLSSIMSGPLLIKMGLGFILTVGLLFYLKPTYLRQKSHLLFKIPLVGPLLHQHYLLRFNQVFLLLIEGGTSVIDAFKSLLGLSHNQWVKESMRCALGVLYEGKPLHEAFEKTPFFPSDYGCVMRQNQTHDDFLSSLVTLHEQLTLEYENRIEWMNHLLEPLVIGMIGIMVGLLLWAMYQPIFKLATVF